MMDRRRARGLPAHPHPHPHPHAQAQAYLGAGEADPSDAPESSPEMIRYLADGRERDREGKREREPLNEPRCEKEQETRKMKER